MKISPNHSFFEVDNPALDEVLEWSDRLKTSGKLWHRSNVDNPADAITICCLGRRSIQFPPFKVSVLSFPSIQWRLSTHSPQQWSPAAQKQKIGLAPSASFQIWPSWVEICVRRRFFYFISFTAWLFLLEETFSRLSSHAQESKPVKGLGLKPARRIPLSSVVLSG